MMDNAPHLHVNTLEYDTEFYSSADTKWASEITQRPVSDTLPVDVDKDGGDFFIDDLVNFDFPQSHTRPTTMYRTYQTSVPIYDAGKPMVISSNQSSSSNYSFARTGQGANNLEMISSQPVTSHSRLRDALTSIQHPSYQNQNQSHQVQQRLPLPQTSTSTNLSGQNQHFHQRHYSSPSAQSSTSSSHQNQQFQQRHFSPPVMSSTSMLESYQSQVRHYSPPPAQCSTSQPVRCTLCGGELDSKCLVQACVKPNQTTCNVCGKEMSIKCILAVCKQDLHMEN